MGLAVILWPFTLIGMDAASGIYCRTSGLVTGNGSRKKYMKDFDNTMCVCVCVEGKRVFLVVSCSDDAGFLSAAVRKQLEFLHFNFDKRKRKKNHT